MVRFAAQAITREGAGYSTETLPASAHVFGPPSFRAKRSRSLRSLSGSQISTRKIGKLRKCRRTASFLNCPLSNSASLSF